MANHPQITVKAEAEAVAARAEVRSVPAPQVEADQPIETRQADVLSLTGRNNKPKDYFVTRDGLRFAGSHLIVDMWSAKGLDDVALIERALVTAIEESGATLLHIHVHKFSGGGGVSGVAVLAESHISVHTWPERGYAAFDIFMCGDARPAAAIPPLKAAFRPENVIITEHKRGVF